MYANTSTLNFDNASIDQASGTRPVEDGLAIIWIKNELHEVERQKLIEKLFDYQGVTTVHFSQTKPSLLNIGFKYNEIRYSDLVNVLNKMGIQAAVVGF